MLATINSWSLTFILPVSFFVPLPAECRVEYHFLYTSLLQPKQSGKCLLRYNAQVVYTSECKVAGRNLDKQKLLLILQYSIRFRATGVSRSAGVHKKDSSSFRLILFRLLLKC